MNVAVGKFGQKLIFNRQSPEATRSSTNGHASAYALYNMLIDANPKFTFTVIGDSDLKNSKYLRQHRNIRLIVDDKNIPDIGIFLLGVINDTTSMCDIINRYSFPYIIIYEDIRCLDYFMNNILGNKIKASRRPLKIIGCEDRMYNEYKIKYIPIECSACYKTHIRKANKIEFMTILANESQVYPRLDIVKDLIQNFNIDVYGRLDKSKQYPDNFKGEVNYQYAQDVLALSYTTLLVPVSKGSVTTKYVEALLNNTLPIFYIDYGWTLLNIPDELVIKDHDEFYNIYYKLHWNTRYVKKLTKQLQKRLIIPYYSGKKLTKMILEEFKNED